MKYTFLGRQFRKFMAAGASMLILALGMFLYCLQQVDEVERSINVMLTQSRLLQLAEARLIAVQNGAGKDAAQIAEEIEMRMQKILNKYSTQFDSETLQLVDSVPSQFITDTWDLLHVPAKRVRLVERSRIIDTEIGRLFIRKERILGTLMYSALIGICVMGFGLLTLFWKEQQRFKACLMRVEQKIRCIGQGEKPGAIETCSPDEDIQSISIALDGMASALNTRHFEQEITHHLVTEKKRLRELMHIALGMANEVSNPMTAVEGAIELLKQKWQEQALVGDCAGQANVMTEECFLILQQQTGRIDWLLRKIKNLNIFLGSRRELSDINEMLQAVITLVQLDQHVGKVSIETSFDNHVPAVMIDRPSIGLSLWCLLERAVEAAAGRTEGVSLSTCCTDQFVEVHIQFPAPAKEVCQSRCCGLPFCEKTDMKSQDVFELSTISSAVESNAGSLRMSCRENKRCVVSLVLPEVRLSSAI